jgi:hypothetical protein
MPESDPVNSHQVTVSGYLLLLAAAILLQVLSRCRDCTVPPLPAVIARAMRTRPGRVAVIAGWAWIGLHFFAR